MMKNYTLFVLFSTMLCQSCLAQPFSGEILYRTTFKSKKAGFSLDSVKRENLGEETLYVITDGYYKCSYVKGGKANYSYTYHHDTKRMFDEYVGKQYITYRDSRKGKSELIRSRVYRDSTRMIAGYKCFMVERIYSNYIQYAYYATEIKINYDAFKDHVVGDWYNSLKEVDGALNLGSVTEYADYIELDEVVKVTPRRVKQSEFSLPKEKLVVASAEALDVPAVMQPPSQNAVECYQQKMIDAISKTDSPDYVSYVGLVVKADGTISNVEPYQKDAAGFHIAAVDVVKNCGLKFSPGQIEGLVVDSFLFLPVEFRR